MRRWLAAAVLALAPLWAGAHDYDELAPLDPALRSALIDVLHAAAQAGELTTDPDAAASPDADGMAALLDRLEPDAWTALADRLRHRAGVTDPARLPDSTLVPLFYDLHDFSAHFEAHEHEGAGPAQDDLRRLQEILDRMEAQ